MASIIPIITLIRTVREVHDTIKFLANAVSTVTSLSSAAVMLVPSSTITETETEMANEMPDAVPLKSLRDVRVSVPQSENNSF